MTETLLSHGNCFQLPEIMALKCEDPVQSVSEFEAEHAFDLLMSDIDGYSPPELQSTLQDKLQEISMLNDVTLEDSLVTPLSGIEATDVCSLYKQFLEYEQASDEALSYPESSIMSPDASPGEQGDDVVLGRLISVQEKLSREVVSDDVDVDVDVETNVDVVCNDNLVMNIPNDEDKILRTINGIHPKSNLLRMADSPKFAKFKKKRLTNEPPLRIAPSLPNTPRCTSPSDTVSSEERKHMEIKLIEALALPVPKHIKNGKHNKESQKHIRKHKDNSKKSSSSCPTKRKHPPVEPIPSRLIPVVSKRFKNNLDQTKSLKDPRLIKEQGANIDPRLSKPDYGMKCNVTQFKNTNLNELNSSTNTATETVDDVCIIDMTIDHEKDDVGSINMTIDHEKNDTNMTINHTKDNVCVTDMTISHESDVRIVDMMIEHENNTAVSNITVNNGEDINVNNIIENNEMKIVSVIENTVKQETVPKANVLEPNNPISLVLSKDSLDQVMVTGNEDTCETPGNDDSGVLEIVINSMCETVVNGDDTHKVTVNCNGANEVIVNDATSETTVVNGDGTSVAAVDCGTCEINEISDDNPELKIVEFPSLAAIEIKTEVCESNDLGNRITTDNIGINGIENSNGVIKPRKNYRKTTLNATGATFSSGSDDEYDDDDRAYIRKKSKKSKNSKAISTTHIKTEKSRSRSNSKTPSANISKSSLSRHSRSPSKVSRRKRSVSPAAPNARSDRHYYDSEDEESEFPYSDRSDRSDCENMDISNKLIELSNPVPYDIEHERKLRFLKGGASKGMGERRNIYAGGITEDTTKVQLADRFRRFGKISKITLHFRDKGDNYAFIVFEEPDNAMRAIEEGNDDPSYPHLDLCFGGRRRFVGGSYVDFDGNNRYLEESDKGTVNNRTEAAGDDDFDRLLQLAINESKSKRDKTPEWS